MSHLIPFSHVQHKYSALFKVLKCSSTVAILLLVICTHLTEAELAGALMSGADPGIAASSAPLPQQQRVQFSSAISASTGPAGNAATPLQHCALSGMLPYTDNGTTTNQSVTLHIWLRVVIQDSTAHAKGFSWMQQTERSISTCRGGQGHFECAAKSVWQWTGAIALKSVTSWDKMYIIDRHQLKFEKDRDGDIQGLTATLQLDQPDAAVGEFQLHAEGFTKHCKWFAERATPAQLLLLQLTPDKAAAADIEAERAARASRPVHHIVSPLFWQSANAMWTVLEPCIQHHEKLGVSKHVQYMIENAGLLAMHPRSQELMASGRLEIMLWDSIPTYTYTRHQRVFMDVFGHQVLQYNHALLINWLEDRWLLFSDPDEFLQIRMPGITLPQALANESCTTSKPLGQHHIATHDAYCWGCPKPEGPDKQYFRNETITGGKHPLLLYKVVAKPSQPSKPKSVVFSTWTTIFEVHLGHLVKGAASSGPAATPYAHYLWPKNLKDTECMRFVHIRCLYGKRDSESYIASQEYDLGLSWFSPYLPDIPAWAQPDQPAGNRSW